MRGFRFHVSVSLLLMLLWMQLSCTAHDGSTARALLEALTVPDGWTVTSEVRSFTADNLWEFINGAAEQYVQYGVQTAATLDLRGPAGAEATLELYRMEDALRAFGVFARERAPGGPFPDVGDMAAQGGASLFFYQGPWYAKIFVFDDTPELHAAVLSLGAALSQTFGESSLAPAALALFPQRGFVPHTEQYFPSNTLGYPWFPDGYTARYTLGEGDGQMFISFCASAADAAGAYSAYRQAVEQDGGRATEPLAAGDEGFSGADPKYTSIRAFRTKRVVGGLLGDFGSDAAVTLLKDLENNLNQYDGMP